MKLILGLLLFTWSSLLQADLTTPPKNVEAQYFVQKNKLKNPGAELSSNWTASAGTFAYTTTSGEFRDGRGFSFDASASAQTVTSNSWTVPSGASQNGIGICHFAGAATDYKFEVYDGSNVVTSSVIAAHTSFTKYELPFVASGGSSYSVRVYAQSNAVEINWDDCYLGENVGITNVSQAYIFGTASQTGNGAGTCIYAENASTALNDFVTFGTGTSCNAWTTTGSVGVTGTTSSSLYIASMPPGDYLFEVSGAFQSNTASQGCLYRIHDGTSALSDASFAVGNGAYEGSLTKLNSIYSITTTQTAKTFVIQAADDGAGNCRLANGIDGSILVWKVYKYPNSSQQVAQNDATLKGWASFTPTGSWTGTTTYTGRYRQVGDSLEVEAKVALSGAPTGTNLDFNIPFSLSIDTTKLTEASGNNINIGTFNGYIGSLSTFNGTVAYQSATSVRLYYQTTGGTPTNSITNTALTATSPGSFASGGQVIAKFKVPIVGWKSEVPVPVLIGSVTSNSSGAERVERVIFNGSTGTLSTLCTSTPCAIYSQSGSWVSSVSRYATGSYNINIATGIFSDKPTCTGAVVSTVPSMNVPLIVPASATSVGVTAYRTSTETTVDSAFNIICMGPK